MANSVNPNLRELTWKKKKKNKKKKKKKVWWLSLNPKPHNILNKGTKAKPNKKSTAFDATRSAGKFVDLQNQSKALEFDTLMM